MNGVLVTYLVDNGIYNWSVIEMGWLLGIPILTGALFRLPIGILTDKYGGKPVFSSLLILCSVPLFLIYFADSYIIFVILSLCFGMVGTSFAVGIAYTSVWYPKHWQGRALGIFGMGNAGAALTTLFAPSLLNFLSSADPKNGWRFLPVCYGLVLLLMGLIFIFFSENKKTDQSGKNITQLLSPLKNVRVWRFGLYYFLVFGIFVALSQWLLPYYVNVYQTSLVMGGLFTSLFSLPSGVIRAFGGYLSDKFGARKVMYWVLGSSAIISMLLMIPKMNVTTPGNGLMARNTGVVTSVQENEIKIGDVSYPIKVKENKESEGGVFPTKTTWQEILVKENEHVQKRSLIAQGITQIHFEAHIWVFSVLVILIGISFGIGKAAVYKHIPEYFPNEVGVVGGMVGLIGGLGGFFGPIIFGYLLEFTGLWTSLWILLFIVSVSLLVWMHRTIITMHQNESPHLSDQIDTYDHK